MFDKEYCNCDNNTNDILHFTSKGLQWLKCCPKTHLQKAIYHLYSHILTNNWTRLGKISCFFGGEKIIYSDAEGKGT